MSVRKINLYGGSSATESATENKNTPTSSGQFAMTPSNIPTEIDPMIHADVPELDKYRKQFNENVRDISDQAISDLDRLYKNVRDTPGEEIDEKYGQYFAKEGRYGNLNNKDFDETLRLSRQADAYNNEPVEKMHLGISYNPSAGQGVGGFETTGYDRPKIETQEMRQMRANERLDETQRALDIQLQHDITKLPYDYYVKSMNEKFNTRMNEAEAKRGYAQITAVNKATQTLMKDRENFNKVFNAKYGIYLGPIVAKLAEQGTLAGVIFANAALGWAALSPQDYYSAEFLDPIFKDLVNKVKSSKMTPEEAAQAYGAIRRTWNEFMGENAKEDVKSQQKMNNKRTWKFPWE